MKFSEKLIRGMKATFASRMINLVTNGLLIILLGRYLLGPDGYGLLFLAISVVVVAQVVADLGLGRSVGRYVAEFKESDPSQIPHILLAGLGYRLLMIGVVCLALLAGRPLIVDLLAEPDLRILLLIGAPFLLFRSLKTFLVNAFQGFNRVEYSAIVGAVNNVGRVAFVVAFVSIGWGVAGALLGYVVGAAVATAIGLAILYTRFYRSYERAAAPEDGLRRRVLEYSIPLTASRSANIIDRRVDILLVGYFLNPVAVGFYTLGKQISEFVEAPAGSVGFALSPAYGEEKANDRLDRAARIYETSLRYVLLLYVPAAVGLVLVAEPAVLLIFGDEYAGAIPVVQILSVFALFKAVNSITTQAIDYLGRARFRALVKGITSVMNFGLNVLLIPTMGVVGAAVATVFTFGLYSLANVYIMGVELPLQYDRILRITVGSTLISALMGGIVLYLVSYVSGFLSLATVILFAVLVWAALVTASGMVDLRRAIARFI